jgi:hypothetical protein
MHLADVKDEIVTIRSNPIEFPLLKIEALQNLANGPRAGGENEASSIAEMTQSFSRGAYGLLLLHR